MESGEIDKYHCSTEWGGNWGDSGLGGEQGERGDMRSRSWLRWGGGNWGYSKQCRLEKEQRGEGGLKGGGWTCRAALGYISPRLILFAPSPLNWLDNLLRLYILHKTVSGTHTPTPPLIHTSTAFFPSPPSPSAILRLSRLMSQYSLYTQPSSSYIGEIYKYATLSLSLPMHAISNT